MEIPMIPLQVTVSRTENFGFSFGKVSHVKHYDTAMMSVFRYFVVLPAKAAQEFTDVLGAGFSDGEYGPFWPSFSSMNSGTGEDKVIWLSEAALECLKKGIGPGYHLHVEATAASLIQARERMF